MKIVRFIPMPGCVSGLLLAAVGAGFCASAFSQTASVAKPDGTGVSASSPVSETAAATKISRSSWGARFMTSLDGGAPASAYPMEPPHVPMSPAPNAWWVRGNARSSALLFRRGLGGTSRNPYVLTRYDGVSVGHGQPAAWETSAMDLPADAGSTSGPNSVAGTREINSHKPSLNQAQGSLEALWGNYDRYEVNGSWSTPLIRDQMSLSVAAGASQREGFLSNPATDQRVGDQRGWQGQAQWLWQPEDDLEIRLIISGESSRDGGYAWADLADLRRSSLRSAPMNEEGYVDRDLWQAALHLTYHADAFDLTSITGFRHGRSRELRDYDGQADFPELWLVSGGGLFLDQAVRTADSFLTLRQEIRQSLFSQVWQISNPAHEPVSLAEGLDLSWQAGLSLFHESLEEDSQLDMAAIEVLNFPFSPVPARQFRASSRLESTGIGVGLAGTLTVRKRLELSAGLRWDYEQRRADPYEFILPVLDVGTPGYTTVRSRTSEAFSHLTPQVSLTYHLSPTLKTYASVTSGATVQESYRGSDLHFSQARRLAYEAGVQGRAFQERLQFGLALFHTDLQNIQGTAWNPWPMTVDATRPGTDGGDAWVNGAEIRLHYQPVQSWELYGQAGWMDARFRGSARFQEDTVGQSLGGNPLPYAPEYTATFGTRVNWPMGRGWQAYAGAEVQFIGPYRFDGLDAEGQSAFSLVSFRAGIRHQSLFAEAFLHNAFGTDYVAMASRQSSPYLSAAGPVASRYVGESGAPMTFGMRVGVRF